MKNVIKNEFDGQLAPVDSIEKKYLKYLKGYQTNEDSTQSVIGALQSHDITQIESSLVEVANSMRSSMLLIGLSCLIIDREALYRKAGYRTYLEYSEHLFEALNISRQTLSDAKIIMSAYIDHYGDLVKHKFNLSGNAHKLRFLEEALENHSESNEVYKRISTTSFREFVEWARNTHKQIPPPFSLQPKAKIMIKNGQVIIDGKNLADIAEAEQESLSKDLGSCYKIRTSGNQPFIVETYDAGEQRAITNFLKKFRSTK